MRRHNISGTNYSMRSISLFALSARDVGIKTIRGIEMRERERIKRITKLVEQIWRTSSDQRFCQLLINLGVAADSYLWQVEDDAIEKHLAKVVKKGWKDSRLI
jgi:hypothetical protein